MRRKVLDFRQWDHSETLVLEDLVKVRLERSGLALETEGQRAGSKIFCRRTVVKI
jgi:hypothetical protein